jgi:hypothetical protein
MLKRPPQSAFDADRWQSALDNGAFGPQIALQTASLEPNRLANPIQPRPEVPIGFGT